MATANGFLNSEDVVFYHPLDNYVDGVQDDTWTGSAAFGPAIISSGLGSAFLGGPVISSGSLADIYGVGNWLVPVPADDTRALFVHPDRNGGLKAQVVSVSGDTISYGAIDSSFPSTTILGNGGNNQAIHISGDLYACACVVFNSRWLTLVSLEASGDTATFNTFNHFLQSGVNSAIAADVSLAQISGATSGGFVFTHYDGVGASGDNVYIRYGQIADNGDISAGSPLVITSGDYSRIIALTDEKAVLIYRDLANGNQDVARVINISGTTLTAESPTDIQGHEVGRNAIIRVNDSCFVVSDLNGNTSYLASYSVSGSNITVESSGIPFVASAQLWLPNLAYDSDLSRGLYVYQIQGVAMSAGYFEVDDSYQLSIGNRTDYAFNIELNGAFLNTCAVLGDDRFLVWEQESELMRLASTESNNIYSENPSSYPSAIGASGLTLGFWVNMSDSPMTILEIGRDCNITIASGYISLGENTAYWNDSGISGLLTAIDNDEDHFLLLDLRYQGSDNWNLYTSLDGVTWTDHGIQNSGSQGLMTSGVAPNISFIDSDGDQLLDEVIFWKDTVQFNDFELSKLHALGNVYDNRMDEYADTEMVFSLFNSGTLFVDGVYKYNDDVTFFMSGTIPEASGQQLTIIDHLTKAGDYDPQLIGVFEVVPGNVDIQVWDIVNGQNTEVTITSSGCYPIGNTGRWGWSTEYLLFTQEHKKYQYYYRMTANTGEQFYGEFFINTPERGRWSYPD